MFRRQSEEEYLKRGKLDVRTIANWFIRRSLEDDGDDGQGPKTQLQLLKLVYFAHGWMLGLYKEPLLKQRVQAWEYGPVVPELYHSIKHWEAEPVTELIDGYTDLDDLGPGELDILDQVYEYYGPKHAFALSDITHRPNTPWFEVHTKKRRPGATIPNKLLLDFFSQDEVDAG